MCCPPRCCAICRCSFTDLAAQPPAGVVIRSAKRSGFIAGADIKEFLKIRTPEEGYELVRAGQTVLQALEDLPCPSVAALHGFALGGGLELALACTYRVGADDASLSLGTARSDARHCIRDSAARCAPCSSSACARPSISCSRASPIKGPRALAVGSDRRTRAAGGAARAGQGAAAGRAAASRRRRFVDKLLNFGLARPFVARQTASTLRAQRAARAIPGALRHSRPVAAPWRRAAARATTRRHDPSASSCARATSRNLVRVFLLQDRLKGLGGKSPAGFSPRACHRRRRHGRRHRGLVRHFAA